MNDVLTRAEKALAESGSKDMVGTIRHLYQQTMEPDFKAAVDRLTGHRVIAFISGGSTDPPARR